MKKKISLGEFENQEKRIAELEKELTLANEKIACISKNSGNSNSQCELSLAFAEASFEATFLSENIICIGQNATAEKIFGYSSEEAIGKPGTDWILPSDREVVLKNMMSGYEKPYEVVALRKDGTSFPVEIKGKMITYEGKKVRVTTLTDITHKKESEDLVSSFHKMTKEMASASTLKETLQICLKWTIRITKMDSGGIYIVNPKTKDLTLAVQKGFSESFLKQSSFYPADSLSAKFVLKGDPIYTNYQDLNSISKNKKNFEKIEAIAIVPILHKDEVIACFNIASHKLKEVPEKVGVLIETIAAQVNEIIFRSRIENRIRESEEKYRKFFMSDITGDYLTTPKGKLIACNPAFLEIFGFISEEDALETNMSSIYRKTPDRAEFLSKIMCEKEIKNHVLDMQKITGEPIIIQENVIGEFDETGKLKNIRGYLFNITDRVLAEKELKESEEKNRLLVDNALYCIHQIDLQGSIISMNPIGVKMIGFDEEKDVIGVKYLDVVSETDRNRINIILEKAYKGSTSKFEFKAKSNQIFSSSFIPILNDTGDVDRLMGFTEDITERIEAEKRLKENENIFQIITDYSSDFIWNIDMKFNLLYASRASKRILGYDFDEMLRINMSDLYNPEQLLIVQGVFEQELARGNNHDGVTFRINHLRKDKTEFTAEVMAKIIYSDNGEPISIQGSTRDISEQIDSQNKLKESEELYKSIFNSAPLGIYHFDINGVITSSNNEFIKILGSTREKLIGLDMLNKLKDKKVVAATKKVLDTGEAFYDDDYTSLTGDKTTPIVINFRAIRDFNNIIIGGVGIVEDVSERKAGEKKLQHSEERFSQLSELTYEGILIHEKGIALDFNLVFSRMFGYEENELLGKNVIKLIVLEKYWHTIAERINSDEPLPYEIICIRKNGTTLPVEIEAKNIIDKNGNLIRVTAVRDITLRKENEREIQKLLNAVEQSHSSIIITDLKGNIEYSNKYFSKISGYSKKEVLGQNPKMLKTDNLEKSMYEDLWKTISMGEVWTGEFLNKKKNGELYWENAVISPVKDKEGKIINYVAIKDDITEWKKAEVELTQHRLHLEKLVKKRTKEIGDINSQLKIEILKKDKAEKRVFDSLIKEKEINQLKDRFMSTVSHDLRTPLTAILTSVELMERFYGKWDKEQVIKKYGQIKTSVSRITDMLSHVLELSRIERGKVSTNFVSVNLKSELQNIVNEIDHIKSDRHQLIFSYKLEIENHSVDIHLIREIITNLLTNGVKYSPDGGRVELIVELDNKWLLFEISDEGMGIGESEIDNIFNDFYRTNESQNISGSGLGLSIVKHYVEMYKGEIEVESKLREGTTFRVKIPHKS